PRVAIKTMGATNLDIASPLWRAADVGGCSGWSPDTVIGIQSTWLPGAATAVPERRRDPTTTGPPAPVTPPGHAPCPAPGAHGSASRPAAGRRCGGARSRAAP